MIRKVDLEEYEIHCPKCDGMGCYVNDYENALYGCKLCEGRGKLDWIDLIKKQNIKFKYEKRRKQVR